MVKPKPSKGSKRTIQDAELARGVKLMNETVIIRSNRLWIVQAANKLKGRLN